MSQRLSLALSSTALLVATLGFTPIGEAAKSLILPANSVGSAQIRTGGVKRVDVAANAINGAKIANGSLAAADLAGGSVLVPGAPAGGDLSGLLPAPTIKDGAVATSKLADGAVSSAKLADASVTPAKLGSAPAVHVWRTTNQSIPTGVVTPVLFDAERFDNAGLHRTDLDTSRITITAPGIYLVGGSVSWEAAGATAAAQVNVRKNGVGTLVRATQQSGGVNTSEQSATTLVKLSAGDYLELVVLHNSGAARLLYSWPAPDEFSPDLWAIWQGPA